MSIQVDLSEKNNKNLKAMQLLDSDVIEIVADASHISIYEFDAMTTKWKRYGVEGSAFITRRSSQPLHNLVVLNKQGIDNFFLDLNTVNKTKIQSPYIMLKCSTSKAPIIYGLWFHDDQERSVIHAVIDKTCQESRNSQQQTLPVALQAATADVSLLKPNSGAQVLQKLISGKVPNSSIMNIKEESADDLVTDRQITAAKLSPTEGKVSISPELSVPLLSPSDFGIRKAFTI